jgi:hypothetical protein
MTTQENKSRHLAIVGLVAVAVVALAWVAGALTSNRAKGQVAIGVPTVSALQLTGQHVSFAGGNPTPTGGTLAAGSSDTAGTFTASAASGSLTFGGAFVSAPTCIWQDSSATPIIVFTVSTTAVTLTTLTSGHVYQYLCVGKAGG